MPFRDATADVGANPWRKWLWRSLLTLSGFAVIYIGATIWAVQADSSKALKAISWNELCVIVSLVALGVSLRACRWHYYIRRLHLMVPAFDSIVVFLASFALTATPGKAGELLKSVLLLRRYHIPVAQSASVLLVERFGDLIAVLFLAAWGLSLFPDLQRFFLTSLVLIGATVPLVTRETIYHPFFRWLARVKGLHAIALKLEDLLATAQTLLRPMPLFVGMSLAVTAWGCEGVALYFLVNYFGIESSLHASISIFGSATLAGAFAMTPGGVGGVEGVMIYFLTMLGAITPVATMAVVLFRFCTLWLFSLVGVCFLLAWTTRLSSTERPAKPVALS